MHNGKIALVTGANRGIGLETCWQLAQKGFTVIMASRDESRGLAATEKVSAEDLDAHFLKLDPTLAADRDAAFAFIESKFGKLDILINNAGVALDKHSKPSDVSEQILRETFDANYFAVVALTQKLLPLLRKGDAGRIVNVSSNLGSLTQHSDPKSEVFGMNVLAYGSSKTALNAFTVHLAHELSDTPIKVNAAHPGWVRTDMGGSHASLDVVDGAKTSVQLATLAPDGPTGGFFHLGELLPW